MRKLLPALACLLAMTGLVYAADYTIVSYDKTKKVITLKDKDGVTVEGRLTEKTKVIRVKDGIKTEGSLEKVEKLLSGENVAGQKLDAMIDNGVITEITTKSKKQ